MSDWFCQACGNRIRGRAQLPAYCPRCGLNKFLRISGPAASQVPGPGKDTQTLGTSAPPSDTSLRSPAPLSTASGPHRDRRSAKRVEPKEPLEVRLSWYGPLHALDISASGLLVEHSRPFTPGTVFDVHLCRAGRRIQLRGQVVRSSGTAGGGSPSAIRYRTGVRFLETPQAIFAFLPELPGTLQSSSSSAGA
jgi:hypothetical protein